MIIVVSISGGKDSTATAILALESGHECRFLFADTGHEHEQTYQYLDYLRDALAIDIDTVKADLTKELKHKVHLVRTKWVAEGVVTPTRAEQIAELLRPTGVPFLDMCLWKGRFPSSQSSFCSGILKQVPIDLEMLRIKKQKPEDYIESWQGVRADESLRRRQLPRREIGDVGEIYRPILHWSARHVFALLKKRGIQPNPLYRQGMSRVGCMPCINLRKSELKEIAVRFPDEVARVAKWERLVSEVSKRGMSTFFAADTDPVKTTNDVASISHRTHGIYNVVEWAKTTRGGRQYDWLNEVQPNLCSSAYGLCE